MITNLEKQTAIVNNNAFLNRIRAALAGLILSHSKAYQSKTSAGTVDANDSARAQYAQVLAQGGIENHLRNVARLVAADATVASKIQVPDSGDTAMITCSANDDQICAAVSAAFDTLALPVTTPTANEETAAVQSAEVETK